MTTRETHEAASKPNLEPISAALGAVGDLVERITDEVGPGGFRGADGIIERHRSEVYAAMEALGTALAEFVSARPSMEALAASKDLVVGKLREFSLTSPVVFYATQGKRRRLSYFELINHLRSRTAAGADVAARVLDDYYVHTQLGESFLHRLDLLARGMAEHASGCVRVGIHAVQLISLQYTGGNELIALAQWAGAGAGVEVTCIDDSVAAVRDAEHRLKAVFGSRARALKAEPLKWLEGPARPNDSACIVSAPSLLEHLPDDRVLRLLQGVHRVLQPGGILLAGCTPGSVPVAEHMIRNWLLGWEWEYRSEDQWRALLARSPFATNALTFDYEPLGIGAVMRVAKGGRQ